MQCKISDDQNTMHIWLTFTKMLKLLQLLLKNLDLNEYFFCLVDFNLIVFFSKTVQMSFFN